MRPGALLVAATLTLSSALAAAQPLPPRLKNKTMRDAGIGLTVTAGATLVTALLVMALVHPGSTGDTTMPNQVVMLAGMPMLAGSFVLAGTGASLWVWGAQPANGAPTARGLGARGFGLRLTF